MNEMEYAITNLEGFLEADIGQGDLHMCSVEIALAALREKAEREKSEQWCKKEANGGLLAICPKCNYPVSWWYRTPFCANCGKQLEEHNEDD